MYLCTVCYLPSGYPLCYILYSGLLAAVWLAAIHDRLLTKHFLLTSSRRTPDKMNDAGTIIVLYMYISADLVDQTGQGISCV